MYGTILEISLKASLLVGVGLLMGLALRRVSASRRHFLYGLTVVGALAMAPITLAAPGLWTLELPIDRPGVPIGEVLGVSAVPGWIGDPAELDAAGLSVTSDASLSLDVRTVAAEIPRLPWLTVFGRILAVVYTAGLVLLLGQLARSILLLRELAGGATDVPSKDWRARVLSELRRGEHLGAVRLAETADCSVPFVWGWRLPVILVPSDSRSWPEARLESVLIHELAHVRQRDVLLRLSAEVLCAFQWVNPMTWMLARRLRADGEAACDDAVLAAGIEPTAYAGELLSLGIERRWHLRVAGAMSGGSPLGRRIEGVLDSRLARSAITRRQRCGVVLCLGFCFAVLVAADWDQQAPDTPAPDRSGTGSPAQAARPPSVPRGASMRPTAPATSETVPVHVRWQSGAESGAAFLGGSIDLDDFGAEVDGTGLLLLIHRSADGGIRSMSTWGGEPPPWVVSDLALLGRKLGGWGDRVWWRGAPLSSFADDASVPQVSGSVMTGLPATTENGSRGTLVAGWESGSDRVGLLACGASAPGMDADAARSLLQRTIDRDGEVVDLAEGECLVAFAWNGARHELRLFESYRVVGGSTRTRFSDGARALPDASSAGWLRALLASGRTHLGLRR